jgi:hypothetical protein
MPVHLLTGASGCYAGGEGGTTGPLLADAHYGTRFKGQPVMWPDGFSARRAGGQVEVLNSSAQVVATTGRLYHNSNAEVLWPPAPFGAFPAAAGCGYPWDFVDCGPVAHPFAPSDLGKQWCAPDHYP